MGYLTNIQNLETKLGFGDVGGFDFDKKRDELIMQSKIYCESTKPLHNPLPFCERMEQLERIYGLHGKYNDKQKSTYKGA